MQEDDHVIAATLTRASRKIVASNERQKLVLVIELEEDRIASSEHIPVAGRPCCKSTA